MAMLAPDPALSAAEALVSFHSAPFIASSPHPVGEQIGLATATAAQQPGPREDMKPVTDKHINWAATQALLARGTAAAFSPPITSRQRALLNERIMNWQASLPPPEAMQAMAKSFREEEEAMRLGLGLAPVDALTEDMAGRFTNLRSDLMAVDGSTDLDMYLLSTYDIHAPSYKEPEERAQKVRNVRARKYGAAGGSSGQAGPSARKKVGQSIKLKPLNEVNLKRTIKQQREHNVERVPLPSIRAILAGKSQGPSTSAFESAQAGAAPAAGPSSTRAVSPTSVQSGRHGSRFDAAAAAQPYLPPPLTHGKIISDAPNGRMHLPRGHPGRLANPQRHEQDNLGQVSSTNAKTPMAYDNDDDDLMVVSAYTPPTVQGARSSQRRGSNGDFESSPPSKRIALRHGPSTGTSPPDVALPVDDILHRQQSHIHELHQQNFWLQQQLLAQTHAAAAAAVVMSGGVRVRSPHMDSQSCLPMIPHPPPRIPSVSTSPASARRMSYKGNAYLHRDYHHAYPQHVPSSAHLHRHRQMLANQTAGLSTLHRKKPYSVALDGAAAQQHKQATLRAISATGGSVAPRSRPKDKNLRLDETNMAGAEMGERLDEATATSPPLASFSSEQAPSQDTGLNPPSAYDLHTSPSSQRPHLLPSPASSCKPLSPNHESQAQTHMTVPMESTSTHNEITRVE
ncbi:uncharacterized protein EV422DRAFT_525587 [Fimicolochytrium jonesii]|uniref:uncharacterized protein n=1 Tax=Fimicolochytrium jonesii TaxID=1396493 RepID=UPI0022FE9BC5|nr:uncharacterized protein EV422DRAFT_525587 [Fimicolochytrium jonesii]KAI8822078.1 hypothetical protein EV422DRAFT_525587 [Fimicolochytrium jonesii]